jgi:hypothetical protein
LKRNIARLFFFLAAISLAPGYPAGPADADHEKIIHFPDKTSLGTFFVVPPGHSVQAKSNWPNARPAKGIVHVPQGSNIALRVSYTAIEDPSLLLAYGPDGFAGLDFSRVEADDKTVARLGELTGLRSLDLRDTEITNQGLNSLAKLKNLEYLLLDGTAISDVGLSSVFPIHTLATLSLDRTAVSLSKATNIQQCEHLQSLSARGCRIADEGMAALSNLSDLQILDLSSNPKITTNGLLQLSALKKLRHLCIEDTAITSKDLPVIQKMTRLMPSLRRITLRGKSFTDAKTTQWQQAFPHLKIVASQEKEEVKKDAPEIFAPIHPWWSNK